MESTEKTRMHPVDAKNSACGYTLSATRRNPRRELANKNNLNKSPPNNRDSHVSQGFNLQGHCSLFSLSSSTPLPSVFFFSLNRTEKSTSLQAPLKKKYKNSKTKTTKVQTYDGFYHPRYLNMKTDLLNGWN